VICRLGRTQTVRRCDGLCNGLRSANANSQTRKALLLEEALGHSEMSLQEMNKQNGWQLWLLCDEGLREPTDGSTDSED
jgi:hypothetical protein